MLHFALTRLIASSIAAFGAITLSLPAMAADAEKPAAESPEKQDEKKVGDPYTLDTCPVSGEKLGSMGAPVVYVHEGQEVKLCCKSCLPDFKKEPAKFLAKLAAKK